MIEREAFMNIRLTIILAYLFLTFLIGLFFRKKASRNSVEFFLAGRNLSKLLLFFTMAASNFSAFTIFGLSGAGYRIGYGFYPVMSFGTGFMALSMYLAGSKIIPLSRERNYLTPADYILDRYGSVLVSKLSSVVMVVFTLPYLALQAIAGGHALHSLTGIPYFTGALLITASVIGYVAIGGLHSIAWTDFLQGLLMIILTVIGFSIIATKSGGFVQVHQELHSSLPSLLMRPGADGSMSRGVWFSYMFLWFFSVPFTPHLLQRFMAAKSVSDLRETVVLYPIVTTVLFFFTISIGVMGHISFPDLAAGETDTIYPLLLGRYTSLITSTVLLTGSVAALMSTMDAQLLTLSSILSLDFFGLDRKQTRVPKPIIEKTVVIILGILGFVIALRPPETLLTFIRNTTFTGLSVLSVLFLGGLYWKGANRWGALSALVVGETMVVLYNLGLLPDLGLLSVIPIVLTSGLVFVGSSLTADLTSGSPLSSSIRHSLIITSKRHLLRGTVLFGLLLVVSNDFWNWYRDPRLLGGLPLWVWYFAGLGILLSFSYYRFFKVRVSSN
jgi:SSS family solute:Na+ symporter